MSANGLQRPGRGRMNDSSSGGDQVSIKTEPKRSAVWGMGASGAVEVAGVILLWVFSGAGGHGITQTTIDVAVVSMVKNAVLLAGYRYNNSQVLYCTLLVVASLLLSKMVLFRWNANRAATLMLVLSILATAVQGIASPWVLGGERKAIPTAKAIRSILKPYFTPKGVINKVRVVLTWACIIGTKICNVYSPLVMGWVVTGLNNGERPYGRIVEYMLLSLAAKGLPQLQSCIYVKVKQTAYIEMSDKVFTHVHSLSLEWHLRKRMGDVVRYMDRGTQAADNVVSYLFLFLIPTLGECVATFVIFYQHFGEPDIASVCLLSFNLYLISTYFITTWRRKLREGMNEHDNDYHSKTTESLMNFETVKYFTAEERERKSYLESVTNYQKFGVTNQLSLSGLNFFQSFIIHTCRAACMVLAANSVYHHSISVGDFVAIGSYVAQLFTPLTVIGSIYNTVIMAFVNMQHLGDLLAETPDVQDVPGAVPLSLPYDPLYSGGGGYSSDGEEGEATELLRTNDEHVIDMVRKDGPGIKYQPVEVEFRNVTFRYPSSDAGKGVRNVSFKVGAGKKVALVGHTGCGKTTLSRLLFRFYDIKEGSILIHGQDVSKLQQKSVRKALGIVPQDTVLFNDTIRKNILYGNPDATEEELQQAVKDAQLVSVIERLPKGWDTVVGERGLRLSGGEKQRVAIARCLLKNPPIIVLDEATSALDSTTEREILEVLQCLSGRTIVVIAHRLSTIQDSDLIVVLNEGEIVETGTHTTLMAQKGAYHKLWKNQENTYKELPLEGGDSPATLGEEEV
eukprot:TRINITY_DN363_c0_g2_i1.p1 TRINITY_DN363_c0_g2~~TRINITY_DN363_c0_g2_i1.p1  ORF type:complete len:828 (+),score=231.99 TRINITY_DN363_c0_g2_i1:105-2486(+)